MVPPVGQGVTAMSYNPSKTCLVPGNVCDGSPWFRSAGTHKVASQREHHTIRVGVVECKFQVAAPESEFCGESSPMRKTVPWDQRGRATLRRGRRPSSLWAGYGLFSIGATPYRIVIPSHFDPSDTCSVLLSSTIALILMSPLCYGSQQQ